MNESKLRSILIIDDDRDDFDLVCEAINQADPAISVSFLDRCENSALYRGKHFDLIMLDINMPAHDGFSWLRGIRQHGYDVPIIMYTNSSNPAHLVKAYAEGATLYFMKPESYKLLMQGVNQLLSLDWSNPASIKEMHIRDGKPSAFQVA
jgi:DNA-binding response OmpR family regulator